MTLKLKVYRFYCILLLFAFQVFHGVILVFFHLLGFYMLCFLGSFLVSMDSGFLLWVVFFNFCSLYNDIAN